MSVEQVKDFVTFLRRNAFVYYYMYLPYQVLRTDTLTLREKLSILVSSAARAKAMDYLVYDYCANINPLEKIIVQTIPLSIGKENSGTDYIEPDSVVLDVGANLGVFSIYMSQFCPRGRVYAFEPVQSLVSLIDGFRRLSGATSLEIVDCALGDEDTSTDIFVYEDSAGVNTLSAEEHACRVERGLVEDHRRETVKVRRLDSFVDENELERVDLIKIDTEGYELNVLRGAVETLRKYRPVVLAQSHFSVSVDQMKALITGSAPDYDFIVERENPICETLIAFPPERQRAAELRRQAARPARARATSRDDYFPNIATGHRWPFSMYHEAIERVIKETAGTVGPDAKCLNIGCGLFQSYPELKSAGTWHVCDIDPRCVQHVTDKYPEIDGLVGGDLSNYPDQSFDFIIATEVIEHIHDPRPWLKQIFRIAKPGARVVISTPNYGFSLLPVVEYTLLEAVARLQGFSRLRIHPNKYTPNKLAGQLREFAPEGSEVAVLKRFMGMILIGRVTVTAKPPLSILGEFEYEAPRKPEEAEAFAGVPDRER